MDASRLRFVLGIILLLLMAQCVILAVIVEPGALTVKCGATVVPVYLSGPLAAPTETARPAWLIAPAATATPEVLH